MDKLIHDDKGSVTISNDGATIMKLLDIVHPAAKILVDIAKSQDSEVLFDFDVFAQSRFSINFAFGFYVPFSDFELISDPILDPPHCLY